MTLREDSREDWRGLAVRFRTQQFLHAIAPFVDGGITQGGCLEVSRAATGALATPSSSIGAGSVRQGLRSGAAAVEDALATLQLASPSLLASRPRPPEELSADWRRLADASLAWWRLPDAGDLSALCAETFRARLSLEQQHPILLSWGALLVASHTAGQSFCLPRSLFQRLAATFRASAASAAPTQLCALALALRPLLHPASPVQAPAAALLDEVVAECSRRLAADPALAEALGPVAACHRHFVERTAKAQGHMHAVRSAYLTVHEAADETWRFDEVRLNQSGDVLMAGGCSRHCQVRPMPGWSQEVCQADPVCVHLHLPALPAGACRSAGCCS